MYDSIMLFLCVKMLVIVVVVVSELVVVVTLVVVISDVWKTKIWFGFGFQKTEPSKNLTSIQAVFRQKLHAISHSNKVNKSNFTPIKCADNERFKTQLKKSLAYRF